jgi:hypothetical protein
MPAKKKKVVKKVVEEVKEGEVEEDRFKMDIPTYNWIKLKVNSFINNSSV